MAAPRQMFDHWLESPQGDWPSLHALDFKAKLSADVTIDPVFKGRVVHVNDEGEFEMGIAGAQMAMFLLQNSDDADVANEGGDDWEAAHPTGVLAAIVANAAVELEDTEFDPGQVYGANDTLTAVASNTNATTGGRITKGTAYTDAICGVVSRKAFANANKKMVLAFWPVYLPA